MPMAATCPPRTRERRSRSARRSPRPRCRCRCGTRPVRRPQGSPRGPAPVRRRRYPEPPFPRHLPATTLAPSRRRDHGGEVRDGPPRIGVLNLQDEQDAARRLLGEGQAHDVPGSGLRRIDHQEVGAHLGIRIRSRRRSHAWVVRLCSAGSTYGKHGASSRKDHHRDQRGEFLHRARTAWSAERFPQSGSTTRRLSSSSCFASIGEGAPIIRSAPDWVLGKAITSRMLSTSA